jgi:hypothetical protein
LSLGRENELSTMKLLSLLDYLKSWALIVEEFCKESKPFSYNKAVGSTISSCNK